MNDEKWAAFDKPLDSELKWPKPEVPSYPEYAAAPLEYPREPNMVALRVGQLTPDQMALRIRELERESLMANGLIGGLYKERERFRDQVTALLAVNDELHTTLQLVRLELAVERLRRLAWELGVLPGD